MPTLKFPGFEVSQPGGSFYVTTMPSALLEKIAYVSVRSKDSPEGIQRYLSEKRVKEVKDFVNAAEAMLANNIIINLSAEAVFEKSDDTIRGTLFVPDRTGEAMVIDGQHRLFGFRDSEAQFDLSVSAFMNLAIDKQAKLFRDINTEQKGIPASLAYDLLDLTKDAQYADLRAHEIVKRLNDEQGSPWFEAIKMQGVGSGLMTQGTFIERLKPHLNPQTGSIGYLEAEPQFRAISNYWTAIKNLQPQAWGKSGYLLTKTLGFSALMDVFIRITEKALEKQDFTVAHLQSILKKLEEFDFSSGGLKGLGGSRGRIELRDRLLSLLNLTAKPKAEVIKF